MFLSVAGADNANGKHDDNNVIFAINDTKFHVPAVTLSARDNPKSLKVFSNVFKKSVYWNEYKKRSDNKNATNEFRYFLG